MQRSSLLFALAAGLGPLAGAAQQIRATHEPITYHVGQRAIPLYLRLRDAQGLADTLRNPDQRLPAQAEVAVVGQVSPSWVVVRLHGFSYAAPVSRLRDFDPADASDVPVDPQTKRIAYEGVVSVPGATQAELFARARAWVAATYDQQNAHVEREDATTGQLRLRGERAVTLAYDYQGVPRPTPAGVVQHTLSIYVKDGRYKYVLTDFTHDAGQAAHLSSGGALEKNHASLYGYLGLGSSKAWDDLKTQAIRDARHLTESLQAAMTLQPVQRPTMPTKAKAKDPGDF